MGSFYTPNIPYDRNTFLDNLPAYSLSEEASQILDTCREIEVSGKYYFMGVPFPLVGGSPDKQTINIPGFQTSTGTIVVPPLSYLLAVSGDSYYLNTNIPLGQVKGERNLGGYSVRIFDKGAKLDVMVNTQYAQGPSNIGVMANIFTPNLQTDHPIGPNFLATPYIVLHPGALHLEITNLSDTDAAVQIFMHFAVPVNRKSANENLIYSGGNIRGSR